MIVPIAGGSIVEQAIEQTADAAVVAAPGAKPKPKHVSVVYFHGIGSQRRYEEVSRLVDCIDGYAARTHGAGTAFPCRIGNIDPAFEPKLDDPHETVTYLHTDLMRVPDGKPLGEVRFYECYWAPVMADVGSAVDVLNWGRRQAFRPLAGRNAQWRELHRLRRSALSELYEERSARAEGEDRGRYDRLMVLFDEFDKHDAKAAYPQGRFEDFLAFVADETAEPEQLRSLKSLARDWRDRFDANERRNGRLILTVLLALILTFLALVGVIWKLVGVIPELLSIVQGNDRLAGLANLIADNLPVSLGATAALVFSGIVGGRIGYYLSHYLGDVEAWATFAETSVKYEKRAKVIDQGTALMRHVLQNDDCARVVVIGHSLGTSIANDVLLALRRVNLAAGRPDQMAEPVALKKIRHVISMGSPVDKINYFFESYRTRSHRYARIVETLRGDIGTPPFASGIKPHIHWVNYWDEADPISGALQSPVGRRSLRYRIDNVHVPGLTFPSPGAAHLAYFRSRRVIGDIFDIVYRNCHTYEGLRPPGPGQSVNYDVARVPPGEPTGLYRRHAVAAALVPWGALASGAAWLVGWNGLALAFGAVAAGGAVALSFWWLTARDGHRDPY